MPRRVWLVCAILLSAVPTGPTSAQQARNPQDEFFLRQARRIDPGTFRAFLLPGAELMEFVCNENNTIPQRLRGTAAEAGR